MVVASVFAFAALSVGLFSAEESKQTIQSALGDVQGTLGLRGSVFAKRVTTSDNPTHGTGDFVGEISFLVSNAAGGVAVDLTPGRTIIRYTDKRQSVLMDTAEEFKSTGLGAANSNQVVEPGEILEVTIINLLDSLDPALNTGDGFTLEVIPPKGAFISIERTIPDNLDLFNDLN